MLRSLLAYVLLVLSCLLGLGSSTSRAARRQPRAHWRRDVAAAPPPPSQDPWYTAPKNYENAEPGAVLRVRSATGLVSLVGNSSAAYNILYRTTDSNYRPAWAVTTLFVPLVVGGNGTLNSTATVKGSSLVSYQTPYDSANVDESPSYTFYAEDVDPSISFALGLGWYVNVPDYEGPLAAYTSGVQSGHATLDAVRAVLNSGFGLSPNKAKYALWGYSGGALASEWAAELQVQYAPELSFSGVALGGLTPNVTSVLETINGSELAYLIVNGIVGIVAQDHAAQVFVENQLKTSGPYNATGFEAVRYESSDAGTLQYAKQNIFDYFRDGPALLDSPLLQALTNRDGIMGYHGVPAMPVFAYKAIKDEISPVADTDALVQRYCAVGANMVYQRNTIGGHVAEFTNGQARAFGFLNAVLTKTPPLSRGCMIRNVTVGTDTSNA